MGYELHIIRRTNWDDDEEESNITLDEWLEYVANDTELELTNGHDTIFNSWQESSGFCYWIGHPKADAAVTPWLSFDHNGIHAKYPDNFTIKKMVQVSIALNARVQGDDGEYYDNSYFEEKTFDPGYTQTANPVTNNADKKPWWKFW